MSDIISALQAIVGPQHVLQGAETAPWARDWSGHYAAAPLAVLRPGSTEQVAAIMRLAHARHLAVVPVGGNTGLSGGTSNRGALMLSLARMNRIRALNAETRCATVEAGVILSQLHDAAEAEDMIFPLFFGARGSAMIGGCLSTNAGGSNVLRYGNTRDLCLGIEAVLADGTVVNLLSALHKDNSGYDLRDLLIGAEGTLGIITAAVMKLHPKPRARATAMVAMSSLGPALTMLNRLQGDSDGQVQACEFMPGFYIEQHMARFPAARAPFDAPYPVNILVETATTVERLGTVDADGETPLIRQLQDILAGMLEEGLIADAVIAQNEAQRREMWDRREQAAEVALTRRPIINNDVAVPLDRVETFLARAEAITRETDPESRAISVAHLGDGNVHFTVWPGRDDAAHLDRIVERIEDLVAELGGSFSAEHGIGLSKKKSMARRKDPGALAMMRAIKGALDPHGILNPGKVLPDDDQTV